MTNKNKKKKKKKEENGKLKKFVVKLGLDQ